jgi:hypothetical protein
MTRAEGPQTQLFGEHTTAGSRTGRVDCEAVHLGSA